MINLVFFLEEPSAREMLKGFIPRLLSEFDNINASYIVFEGKTDLEKQIVKKLKVWNKPDCRFVVLRDKDSGDCHTIKAELAQKCIEAGKPDCLIRIACYELESWYLGDLSAVEIALEIQGLSKKQNKRKYRQPDDLANAAEELEKLTDYKYQKISGSKKLGHCLSLCENKSHSFNVFVEGIKKIIK